MNSQIVACFDNVERSLLESKAVSSYAVIQREASLVDGKLRIRTRLKGGGLLEIFEYITMNADGETTRSKYSYHWQGADDFLVRRWDNVFHYPDLPYAPHHVHLPDGSIEGVAELPDAVKVLEQIEAWFEQEQNG